MLQGLENEVERGVDLARAAGWKESKKDIPLGFNEGLGHVFSPSKFKELYENATADVADSNKYFERIGRVQNGNVSSGWGSLGEIFGF